MVDFKLEFSKRLIEMLVDAGHKDPRSHSGLLAKFTGKSRTAAGKWLNALSMPETDRIFEIAIEYNVSSEWLATGRGTKDQHIKNVAEPKASYGELGCKTDRDRRIMENIHKMSESDQSRYEEFSRIMGAKPPTTPTGSED